MIRVVADTDAAISIEIHVIRVYDDDRNCRLQRCQMAAIFIVDYIIFLRICVNRQRDCNARRLLLNGGRYNKSLPNMNEIFFPRPII